MIRDGVLNIDKPSGWTSHDVVARLRTLLNAKKVGHAGTLDPGATGVLPVCFGKGTKIVEHLVGTEKEYRVVMRLGEETDTEDASGTVLRRTDAARVGEPEVARALGRFVGSYDQLPPIYSAIKVKGLPMYKSARAGKTVERKARRVTVHRIDFEGMRDRDVRFTVLCAKGTYVRTLCADAGRALSVGAHLLSLCRTRVGMFRLEEAVGLAELEREMERGSWAERVYPLDLVLGHLPAVTVDERWSEKVCHGVSLPLALLDDRSFSPSIDPKRLRREGEAGALVRVRGVQSGLLALARIEDSATAGPVLKIEKVLIDVQEQTARAVK
jgi:tRNA pseudouridine55 synthase